MSVSKGTVLKREIFKNKTFTKIQKLHSQFQIESHFQPLGFKLHLLDQGPSSTVELSKNDALKFYKQMLEIRKMEDKIADLYFQKKIRGFCHLYSGQEAVAVGINSVMRPKDTVITSYRCHGWQYLKCGNMVEVLGELLGLVSGCSRGKGGSIHMYGSNFYGGNGIVAAQIPVGVGIALAHKYTNSDSINIALCGDGAASQGQCFEAYNLAKLHNLPIIFVIENNHYGMFTEVSRSSANPKYYKYNTYLPGIRVNGNDILSVIEATKFAYQYILDGKGPILLEMMTYRYFGHSMSDPQNYREHDEIKEVKEKKDPCKHLRLLILDGNLATEEEVRKIQDETLTKVSSSAKQALKSRPPGLEELTADVYKEYNGRIRTPQMLTDIHHKNISVWDAEETDETGKQRDRVESDTRCNVSL